MQKKINYWKRHYQQNINNFPDDLIKQVDKTIDKHPVGIDQINLMAKLIKKNLDLKQDYQLLDLCCGNGVITEKIGKFVKKVIAIDISEDLINIAKKYNRNNNIRYIRKNILKINNFFLYKFRYMYMHEALQLFEYNDFKLFLKKFSSVNLPIKILLMSIPDKSKIFLYYNTEEKKNFFQNTIFEDKPHMGKWWEKKELKNLANSCGFACEFLKKNSNIFNSYYRFDAMLKKKIYK